jgi:hypothetical protein
MKNLLIGLTAYFGENGGSAPPSLRDLSPEYIQEAELVRLTGELLYLPGLLDADRAQTPIIALPAANHGQRLVGYIDGSVQFVPEARFQAEWQATEEMVGSR